MKLNVGVSRKAGLPDYGSVGASCNLELELEQGLLGEDLRAFHSRVRDAYVAAHQAVHDELERLQTRPGAGPRSPGRDDLDLDRDGELHAPQATERRSRRRRDATPGQLRAIEAIAHRRGTDLPGLLRREFDAERLEDLTLGQASALIDLLKGGEARPGDRHARRRREQTR